MPALRNRTNPQEAGPSNDPSDATLQEEELANANAEIERLKALLAARDTPTPSETSTSDRLANVLETLSQRLAGANSAAVQSGKTTKIPDPPLLTDGKEPTFESWKLQIQGKLQVNSDHFFSNKARIAYVFSRTGGNAQKHLQPRYDEDSKDLFQSDEEMIKYLASIYKDPHRI